MSVSTTGNLEILKNMASEQSIKTDRGIIIDISLTNQDLTNLIGTSRETANRILNDFKRHNAIEVKKDG